MAETRPPASAPSLEYCHFSGLAGGGMSALAQYLRFSGKRVSGSDRLFDKARDQENPEAAEKRAYFTEHGIGVFPQDGSGLTPEHTALVVSTAIEAGSPEILRAATLGIPVLHRSELLAQLCADKKTVAVAGTSGKSTVSGMAWHVLESGGLQPSLITGANLPSLQERGLLGNAYGGKGAWLVIEADESDGSLVRYRPEVALLLNIEKDHQEVAELMPLFRTFRAQSKRAVINQADMRCLGLKQLGDVFFDRSSAAGTGLRDLVLNDWGSSFTLDGARFDLSVPGRHNVENALAAIALGRTLGISFDDCARGLRNFKGVERRFTRVGEARGVTVIDDFAHNPAKVRAALETARALAAKQGGRLLAIFHPHGFAPMKLMGRDIMDFAAGALRPEDHLYLPEIYYAGGTADKTISSADLIDHLNGIRKGAGTFVKTKPAVAKAVAAEARTGDVILSMGARDPDLGAFAASLLTALESA
jgi:UDP-N-acetylmuramate--L-alanine ligase